MTDAELIDALNARQAMIVHLSHYAKMREDGTFPEDLQAAVKKKAAWTLSCVVLWPGHRMALPGSVGVIFRPHSTANIVSVSSDDAGSMQLPDGSDGSLGNPLSETTFDKTFIVREGTYNEWRVKDCDVVGIFVASKSGLLAKKKVPLRSDGVMLGYDIASVPIEFTEVSEAFPDLPIYTMADCGWHKLLGGRPG